MRSPRSSNLTIADIRAMIDDQLVFAHRQRALSPDHPVIRGTAQNPGCLFPGAGNREQIL